MNLAWQLMSELWTEIFNSPARVPCRQIESRSSPCRLKRLRDGWRKQTKRHGGVSTTSILTACGATCLSPPRVTKTWRVNRSRQPWFAWRAGDGFWSWLTVLARTAFADERKKRQRYFFFLERFKRQAEVEGEGATDDQADERLNTLLRRHVASLPPNEQKLIELKYIERRTVREIAGGLQMTEKAVESQLSRIRRKLKDATLKELNRETRE